MDMKQSDEIYRNIKDLIAEGKTQEALQQSDNLIKDKTSLSLDYLYYLRGNAYRKQGDWPSAINNYLKAIELNPDSPASEAYRIAVDIQEFYNKDMYNQ